MCLCMFVGNVYECIYRFVYVCLCVYVYVSMYECVRLIE
jgi:hypothetical protein